jgi:hypothetical protein
MKMKKYESFDAYAADQAPANRAVIKALRAFVKRTAPGWEESVKWGNGVWLSGGTPVCYIYSAPDHTQFGFFNGAALKDPEKLLRGKAQYVRHIRLLKKTDIQPKAFTALIKQAAPARSKA